MKTVGATSEGAALAAGSLKSINPANGELLQSIPRHDEAAVERILSRAAKAFERHRRTSPEERAAAMSRAAEILESEREQFGRLMTLEMGKLRQAGIDEAAKCAWVCRYYAANAARMLAEEPVETNASHSYIRYDPIGAVLGVMPWNFPFWQVFRFAVPALMAGNVGLLKHASNVPQCAVAIEEIFRRAGFTEDAFQTLLIGSSEVARLIEDERIAAVTLTGSEGAGSKVAERAGKCIKKTVLELGGSDPFLILPSADLERAVAAAVQARTINNGQSCIAAKRFLVADSIADKFERQFVQALEALRVGDPMDPQTQLGPLATAEIADLLEEQVRASVRAGARVLTGGRRLDRPGFYYAATALTDIPPDSPAAREELFGPVAGIFHVRDTGEAIALANRTRFGLGASVWTNEPAERDRLVAEIEAGMVFVNGMVASDPRLPFGGVKRSGYGRELSAFGLREFVNIKTVWIR